MKKINLKNQVTVFIVTCLLVLTATGKIFSEDESFRQYRGKVIFSDTKNSVSKGTIKVFKTSEKNSSEILLETAVININGEFSISVKGEFITDRIKIMCYPDDLDNSVADFETNESYIEDILEKSKNTLYDLVIEVKRIDNKDKGTKD